MRIVIEANGYRMTVDEADLENFGLSIPSDVYIDQDGQRELGRVHISLTGLFREGFRPQWEEIS